MAEKPFFLKEYILHHIEQAHTHSNKVWDHKFAYRLPSIPKTKQGQIRLCQSVEKMYHPILIAENFEINKKGDFTFNWLTWDVDRSASFRQWKEDFLCVCSHQLVSFNRGLNYIEHSLPVRISGHAIQRIVDRTPHAKPKIILDVLRHTVLSAVSLWPLFAMNKDKIVDSAPFLLSSKEGSFVGDYVRESQNMEIRTFLTEEDMSYRKKSMAVDVGIWSFSHAQRIESIATQFATRMKTLKNNRLADDQFGNDIMAVCNSYATILKTHEGVLKHHEQRVQRKNSQNDLWFKARHAQEMELSGPM